MTPRRRPLCDHSSRLRSPAAAHAVGEIETAESPAWTSLGANSPWISPALSYGLTRSSLPEPLPGAPLSVPLVGDSSRAFTATRQLHHLSRADRAARGRLGKDQVNVAELVQQVSACSGRFVGALEQFGSARCLEHLEVR